MKKLGLVAVIVSSFCAGVAFVVACGNGAMDMIDAADAPCAECEPPIGAGRIYMVKDTTSGTGRIGNVQSGTYSIARCDEGDILMGGGCWLHEENARNAGMMYDGQYKPLSFGPAPAVGDNPARDNEYNCVYDEAGLHVVATAICFKPATSM